MGRKRLFNDREKWCNKCEKWLPLDSFGDNKRTASGKSYYCRNCHNTYCGTFSTKVDAYLAGIADSFHLTQNDYIHLWEDQHQKCAVCDDPLVLYNRKTVIDFHDGRVWGLLCSNCKKGIDLLNPNVARAYAYVGKNLIPILPVELQKTEAATSPV